MNRQDGVVYTTKNPFLYDPFIEWAERHDIKSDYILEPFAGLNNLITMLRDIGYCNKSKSFDITPNDTVQYNDSISNFPRGFNTVITNPPWLYKSSATLRGLSYNKMKYDNVYLHCIDLIINNSKQSCVIVPASFISTRLFLDKISDIILIHDKIFTDTSMPVCMVLFENNPTRKRFYHDNTYIDDINNIHKRHLQYCNKSYNNIQFNVPDGELGLVTTDSTTTKMYFYHNKEKIKLSKGGGRYYTAIKTDFTINDNIITKLNNTLNQYRKDTHDYYLTPFRGLRKDKKYRRRISYIITRKLIYHILSNNSKLF